MEQKQVEIGTRLGPRLIDLDKVVHFPRGIAGFEDEHDFIILQIRPDAPLLVLQSMSNPNLGLLVADPYIFLERVQVSVGEAELSVLQMPSIKGAAVLMTVTIPPGAPEKATLNLTGPIFINYAARIGLQVPQNIDGPASVCLSELNQPRGGRED